jgi:hypothetical protein
MAVETRSAECLMNIPAILSRFAGKGLLLSENGYLRWYVASMSIGAVVWRAGAADGVALIVK